MIVERGTPASESGSQPILMPFLETQPAGGVILPLDTVLLLEVVLLIETGLMLPVFEGAEAELTELPPLP